MWISDISIRRPVFATMVILSFMVLGVVSLTRLGIDLFPEVNFPFVNISVVYPGASPEEVETLVTRPLEDAVAGINGVKRVVSSSTESFSRVGLELRLEVDPQAAAAEVREKVAAMRSRLPAAIEDPTIVRFDVAALPIMTFAVGSGQRSDRTRVQVEDDIKPLLEQIDGVAAVEVNGGEVREIQVELDPRRLEALGLPVAAVAEALAGENLDLPGGTMEQPGRTISLRTKGEFVDVAEIEDVILRSVSGSTVRVRDVGRVVDGFEERTSTTRLDGEDAVSFSIKKQSGANTAAIAERVHAALGRIRATFPHLEIKPIHDDSEFIRSNVAEVRESIIFGALMAVLVVFLFMRDWRSTVITALALPTSVIATFFFMWLAGFTINMMTLMALSLVIGILIDDAVVVRENIYRHMEHGEDAMTAAHRGTAEIGVAVMATTFTILAVFLPVGFMTGIVGQFFKSFALTIAFAVAMSLLVAFTLDPMLSSRFVRYVPLEERMRTRAGRLFERWGRAYDRLDRLYHRVLGAALNHPWKTLAAAAGVFVASLSTITVMGTEFVPAEDRGEFQAIVELPPGTSFDESVAAVARVERAIQAVPEVTQVFSTVGVGQARISNLRVRLTKKTERARDIGQIKEQVRALMADMPFVDGKVADPEFMQGAPYEPPINVYVRGDDLAALQRVTSEIQARVRTIPGAVDISSNLESGQPEIVARIHRALAADLGFSVGSIASQLRGMVEGLVPTHFRDGDREHDIRVRLAPEFRNDPEAVLRTPLYAPSGASVRTGDVVAFAPAVGPSNIDREQRRRQAVIGIDLATGYALGDVTAEVQRAVDAIDMPATFEWGFAGDVELMQESAAAMGLALILAIAFIYIVLASQFESFLQPGIIMLSLPLALVGALLLLLATGKNLGMPAMIGVVMLMGLVTKNAILLVDYTNQLRRGGRPIRDALLEAGPVRLRPILMTTTAMILGMLPSALKSGDGSEFRAPIAIATIGGLITSTMLTLVVVPVAYLLLEGALERLRAWRHAPLPAGLRTAARVTGALMLLALVGAFLSVASAWAAGQGPGSGDRGLGIGGQGSERLTIDRAIELAITRNEGLKVTRERLRESQANVAAARAAFLPSLNLNVLYTPAQESPLLRIPAGVFGPTEQTFRVNMTRENIVRVDVSQPLYTGGRLTHAFGVQAAVQEGSRLEVQRGQQALTLRVYETFYAALMADQGVRTTDEGVRIAERHLELSRVRFEAGTAARLDVLRAEVELANARARLIRARTSADVSRQALRTVLSLPPDAPLPLSGTLDEVPALPAAVELQNAMAVRPDIRAFGQQREAAERQVALANAELKPMVALSGNFQYQEDGVGRLFGNSNRSSQVGVALQVPLFNASAVAARRAVASARVRQAEHGVNAALDTARLELASAATEVEAAREIVATQEKAVALARESLGIAEVSYENGVITAAELNDARLSLLETEWELTQAKYAQIVAAARTRFAAGL